MARHPARLLLAALVPCLVAACNPEPAAPVIAPTQVIAVDTPPPAYPLEVACEGLGGTSELSVTIGTEGTVTAAELRQGSGQAALDDAALEAVGGWQFRPATANGQPVEAVIRVPVTFNPPPSEPEDCYFLRNGGTTPSAPPPPP